MNRNDSPNFSEMAKDYVESTLSDNFLQAAIEWVAKNLNPEDVFSESNLQAWAEDNDYEKV